MSPVPRPVPPALLMMGASTAPDGGCPTALTPYQAYIPSVAIAATPWQPLTPFHDGVPADLGAATPVASVEADSETRPRLPRLGAVLGPYQLTARIGRGGHAVIYRAVHRTHGTTVAVKLSHPRTGRSPEQAARDLCREAELLARVQHPHVVRLLDFRPGGAFPHLVLEDVPGLDLHRHLGRYGPLPVVRAVRLLGQMAEALGSVHAAGLVHCDVKPANILLGRCGTAKLTDLGIAWDRTLPGTATPLDQREALATPLFMAPELARNVPPIDHRADLYALGVTFYQTLTGACLSDPDQAGSTAVRPFVPLPLVSLIERLTAAEPAERFADASAVRAALVAFAGGERWA